MKRIKNVLSLFDGKSCGRVALGRAGISVDTYHSAEIDKYAIQVADNNYPQDTENRLGDVTKWREWEIDWSKIDLVFAGFPCQAWSLAGKGLGDKDARGMLFWTMLEIIEHVNDMRHYAGKDPVKYLIENVKMKKEFEEYITYHTEQSLGKVEKTLINSALVSAQTRKRYYWTNWKVSQPEDKEIMLSDILLSDNTSELRHTSKAIGYMDRVGSTGRRKWEYMFHSEELKGKSQCVTANFFKGVPNNVLREASGVIRKFHPVECERLQTLPDEYTAGVSNTQRYKMIGNGWNIDTIVHILMEMNNENR